jgi:hypothetical protein
VAEQETRTLSILPGARSSLPVGDYGFLEMFCDERGCDCRRVFFSVVSAARQEIEAVIAWGWENPEFYAAWMQDTDPQVVAHLKGPVLNVGSPASVLAPALLELTRTVLLQDVHYIERIKRHYHLFRQRIEGGRSTTGHPRTRRRANGLDISATRTAPIEDEHQQTQRPTKTRTSTGLAQRADRSRRSVKMSQQPRVSPTSEKPPKISLVHYKITTEPIEDRHYKRLPQHVKDAIERLHDVAQRRPRAAIPELRDLITQYPRIPQLYNYLSVAYGRAGQRQEAEAVVQENYHRNPEYLFARLNYAEVCLARKDYAQVADIFGHTFDLQALYPQRKRFHLSEVANFLGVVGLYLLAIGNRELAEHYHTQLQQLAPEFPLTTRLHKQLFPGLWRRLWRRVTGRSG